MENSIATIERKYEWFFFEKKKPFSLFYCPSAPSPRYSPIVLTYDAPEGDDEDAFGGGGGPTGAHKLPPGILPAGLPQVEEVRPAITRLEQEQQERKKEEAKGGRLGYVICQLSVVTRMTYKLSRGDKNDI